MFRSIVAVHGIGAHPYYSWEKDVSKWHIKEKEEEQRSRRKKVHWLSDEDMLPRLCPKARIMTFGYESQWFGDNALRTDLSSIQTSL